MKSFDKWVDELKEQINKPARELPDGIVEGNTDGEYLYQCRACGDWNPIDWDLDEDSYEGHYCGKGPQCCPLPTVSPGRPPVGTPLGGKPMPAQKPKRPPMPSAPPPAPVKVQTHVMCPACKMRIPPQHSPQHPTTGQLYCGRRICEDYIHYNSLLSPSVQCFVCMGCGMTTPQSQAKQDKVTGLPFCGAHSCQARLQQTGRSQPIPPPPPRAG